MTSATIARREARRTEMLEAALDLIRREGPEVSMEELAAACGVTKPIVYRHFGDRDGLVQAMGAHFVTGLVFELAEAIRADLPVRQRVTDAVDTFVGTIEADPEVYRFLVHHAPPAADQFVAALLADEVAKVLRELLAESGLDPSPAEIWAYGIVGMVHFAGDWWAARRAVTRDELVDRLTDLLLSGLEGTGLVP
jgi:AcrR family transcriptional regulator